MRQTVRLNPFDCPPAPALHDCLSQDISGVGASFFSHHEGHEEEHGTADAVPSLSRDQRRCTPSDRATSHGPRVTRKGILTRRCDGSFHRPDSTINGAVMSTKMSHHEEHEGPRR